jgi:hypothetical protein
MKGFVLFFNHQVSALHNGLKGRDSAVFLAPKSVVL